MSKKTAVVVPTQVSDQPKPPAIPTPDSSPAVVAARSRYYDLTAKLTAIRSERRTLERNIGVKDGDSYDDAEAKLLARGLPTDDLTRLRELRRTEGITEKATHLLRHEVTTAREIATRELTAQVRQEVFLPGVRAAISDWLETLNRFEKFRLLVADIQDRGVGGNTHSPFNARVPLSLADRQGTVAFVNELIADGFTDADAVNAIVPGLL